MYGCAKSSNKYYVRYEFFLRFIGRYINFVDISYMKVDTYALNSGADVDSYTGLGYVIGLT